MFITAAAIITSQSERGTNMTQTLRFLNKEKTECDIWYHPNNAKGKKTDTGVRFCYTVEINPISMDDVLDYYATDIDNLQKDISEDPTWGLTLLIKLAQGNKYIVTDNKNETYFAKTKAEAIGLCSKFYC